MADLLTAAMRVQEIVHGKAQEATAKDLWAANIDFVDALLYATADEIKTFVNESPFGEDLFFLPVWLRVLTLRLAGLQAPDDPNLLRWAAAELFNFANLFQICNEWNDHVVELDARIDLLDPGGESRDTL